MSSRYAFEAEVISDGMIKLDPKISYLKELFFDDMKMH